jgi:hypothetical protein
MAESFEFTPTGFPVFLVAVPLFALFGLYCLRGECDITLKRHVNCRADF